MFYAYVFNRMNTCIYKCYAKHLYEVKENLKDAGFVNNTNPEFMKISNPDVRQINFLKNQTVIKTLFN